jgi:hypothetical protein
VAKLRAKLVDIHQFAREHPQATNSIDVGRMSNPWGVIVTFGSSVLRFDVIDEYVDDLGFGGPTPQDVGDRYLALYILGPLLDMIPKNGASNA